MQAFQAADWDARAKIAETIENDRYRELARRLVFVNAPESLAESCRGQLNIWLQNRRHGREGIEAGRTIEDAMAELERETSTDQSPETEAIRSGWILGFGLIATFAQGLQC